jgi:hypothetical protein
MADDVYETARHQVKEMTASITDEAGFEEVLDFIAERTQEDLSPLLSAHEAGEAGAAQQLFDSIEAWASLTSAVTFEMYVGPVREVGAARFSLPGWAKGISQRLDNIVSVLKGYLQVAARALGAPSFSIALTFPFGVSVGLAWN